MEKERNKQKVVLVILLILLIGLSIGFAAFNANLKIQTGATVKPDPDSFKVVFSSSATSSVEGAPVCTGKAEGGAFAKDATIISGLTANFTAPGEQATWKFYSYNSGKYDAFLNKVIVGTIECTSEDGISATKLAEAANHINIKVSVGGNEFTITDEAIDSHELAKNQGEEIIVTLTYGENSPLLEGNVNVSIGDITLGYDSID